MKEENCDLSPYFGESYLEGRAGNVSLRLNEVFESVMHEASLMMGENFHQ